MLCYLVFKLNIMLEIYVLEDNIYWKEIKICIEIVDRDWVILYEGWTFLLFVDLKVIYGSVDGLGEFEGVHGRLS